MKINFIKNIYFATHVEKERFVSRRKRGQSYALGFLFSILLTVLAYLFVVLELPLLSDTLVIGVIFFCAIVQLFVQMYYFLHLGSGSRPRWGLFIFVLTLIILFILVGGSLWIMTSLNTRMMPELPASLSDFVNTQMHE